MTKSILEGNHEADHYKGIFHIIQVFVLSENFWLIDLRDEFARVTQVKQVWHKHNKIFGEKIK